MFFLILIKGKNILRMNKNSSRCLGETRIYWKEIRSTKTYLYIFTYESCLKLLKEDVFKVHQLVSCQLLISFLTFINFIFLAIIMYHDMKDQEVVPGVWRGCWCCWRGSPWGSSRQRCQCPEISPV